MWEREANAGEARAVGGRAIAYGSRCRAVFSTAPPRSGIDIGPTGDVRLAMACRKADSGWRCTAVRHHDDQVGCGPNGPPNSGSIMGPVGAVHGADDRISMIARAFTRSAVMDRFVVRSLRLSAVHVCRNAQRTNERLQPRIIDLPGFPPGQIFVVIR